MTLNVSSDSSSSFCWDDYLIKTKGKPAKAECFRQSLIPPPNHFEINTLLEAEDQRSAALDVQSPMAYSSDVMKTRGSIYSSTNNDLTSSSLLPGRRSTLNSISCGTVRRFRAAAFSLARVVETWGPRLRIRLVGTDDRNDYWLLVDSEQIRPYPSGNSLHPPFGYIHNHLVWNRTLKKATDGAKFADSSWFVKPPPDPENNYFEVNDKLEAVDRRNTQLICPASIGAVNGQHVLISFDGWSGAFDYWARFDSRELFPVGWCKMANYPLQSPGPNIIRSPTNHSTSTIPRLTVPLHKDISSYFAPSTHNNRKVSTKSKRHPSSTISSRRRTKSYSHSNKSALFRTISVRTPFSHAQLVSVNNSVSDRNSFPLSISTTVADNWSAYDKNHRTTFVISPKASSLTKSVVQVESTDSSNCSFSSPPTIHPILDDPNDSLTNLSPSSQSDHPPKIEAAVPFPGETQHPKRSSSSSDCVVRLQAKSPSNCEPLQPEFKSWQVVTEPRPKSKKTKTTKHRRRDEKEYNGLKKKLKLVNGSVSAHLTSDINGVTKGNIHSDSEATYQNSKKSYNDFNSNNNVTTTTTTTTTTTILKNDIHTLKSVITSTSHLEKHIFNPKLIDSDMKNDCKLLTDQSVMDTEDTFGKLHSASIYDQLTLNPYQNIGDQLIRKSDMHHTEMDGANNKRPINLTIDTVNGSAMGWLEAKTGTGDVIKSMDPVTSTHQNLVMLDYLDSQSLTTHLPSSTVSPSSLDLGPCPLPNPSQWTIDEVYHYITTRDSTLIEAAEKFKHHEIDGQALLLLTMESLRNYMKIKLGPALKVDHLINRLKRGLL